MVVDTKIFYKFYYIKIQAQHRKVKGEEIASLGRYETGLD
jgi:hypothetical protein